jgi:hypothetical protein
MDQFQTHFIFYDRNLRVLATMKKTYSSMTEWITAYRSYCDENRSVEIRYGHNIVYISKF